MSIRLNKALRELNIGFQTAVEFLEKRSDIGEEKLELTSKISDAQYSALVEAFKQDAAVRNEAASTAISHSRSMSISAHRHCNGHNDRDQGDQGGGAHHAQHQSEGPADLSYQLGHRAVGEHRSQDGGQLI